MSDRKVIHLSYPTHKSYVFQLEDSLVVHCVKYSDRGLEWEFFENDDWTGCQEYMIQSLPGERWGFEEDPE